MNERYHYGHPGQLCKLGTVQEHWQLFTRDRFQQPVFWKTQTKRKVTKHIFKLLQKCRSVHNANSKKAQAFLIPSVGEGLSTVLDGDHGVGTSDRA